MYGQPPPKPHTLIEKLGKPIWENLYNARIRYKDTLSVEHIKQFGMPTVGDTTLDKDMHIQPLNVCITINDMVEYFREGVGFTLANNIDAETIYNIINNYLLAWKDQVDKGINIGDAPYKDLMLMDSFATALFPQASKFAGTGKPIGSLFANLFTNNGNFVSRNSLFGDNQPIETAKVEHNTLAKMFASSMKETGRNSWK